MLDASLLVAAARPSEPFHNEAKALLQRLMSEQVTLHLPIIALAEIAAAISRGVGDEQLALQVVAEYRDLPQLSRIEVDERLGDRAAEVAARYRIRGCDAVYVALADLKHAALVTLDRQQRERASSALMAYTPSEVLAVRLAAGHYADSSS